MQASNWVKEARQGSSAAQKCLFDLFADRMMVLCRRYVKSPLDAEEILLDGFCQFFRSLDKFIYQGESALYAWIKRIMINQCLIFLRKKAAFAVVSETAADDLMIPDDALSSLGASEILLLIVQLPAGYRTVFNLHVIEGYSHAEIATMLGIQEGSSRSQLTKAKQLLQKMVMQNQPGYANRQSK